MYNSAFDCNLQSDCPLITTEGRKQRLGDDALVVGGIERRIETLAVLNVRIKQVRKPLAEIEETTWDVTLPSRHVGLSAVDGRPYVKLHKSVRRYVRGAYPGR